MTSRWNQVHCTCRHWRLTHSAFTGRCGYCECRHFTPDDPYKFYLTEGEEQALEDALRENKSWVVKQMYNLTECPHGCDTPNTCEHGYNSLKVRAGLG